MHPTLPLKVYITKEEHDMSVCSNKTSLEPHTWKDEYFQALQTYYSLQ